MVTLDSLRNGECAINEITFYSIIYTGCPSRYNTKPTPRVTRIAARNDVCVQGIPEHFS